MKKKKIKGENFAFLLRGKPESMIKKSRTLDIILSDKAYIQLFY